MSVPPDWVLEGFGQPTRKDYDSLEDFMAAHQPSVPIGPRLGPDGLTESPFTEAHPYPQQCGNHDDHAPHKERTIKPRLIDGAQLIWWVACPGWTNTHKVTVTDATGRVIFERPVDLSRLDGESDAELTMKLPEYAKLPADEQTALLAVDAVAPMVCPYDCERCHEHLWDLRED